ncbi:MAG: galactose oxidase [Blastocatellia bacterium]|nr:galactose oxidase [Blastocatellia bacterium]
MANRKWQIANVPNATLAGLVFGLLLVLAGTQAVLPAPPSAGWSKLPSLPVALTNNAVAACENNGRQYLFSFLGIDPSLTHTGITRRAYSFEMAAQTWRAIRPVPGIFGRLAATAQGVKGKIYLFGGYTVDEKGQEVSLAKVNIYDPATDSYSLGEDIPVPVDDAVSGVWRDRYIFLISGWSQKDNVTNVQIYDTQKDTWYPATPLPAPGRFGHAGAIVGDTIVIADGVKTQTDKPKYVMEGSCYVGKIDPQSFQRITWTRIAEHPGKPRYRMAAGVLANRKTDAERVYFTGGTENPYNYNGIGYNGQPAQPTGETFAFNTRTNQWETLPSSPVPTMDHRGLASLGNSLFLIGGIGENQRVQNSVYELKIGK